MRIVVAWLLLYNLLVVLGAILSFFILYVVSMFSCAATNCITHIMILLVVLLKLCYHYSSDWFRHSLTCYGGVLCIMVTIFAIMNNPLD